MTPATAASTTGHQHNFCSGQTLLVHAPSGRTEPHPGRLRKGNLAQTCVNHERDSNRIIVQTRRYSLELLRDVDDPRRSLHHHS